MSVKTMLLAKLSESQFTEIGELVKSICGINLNEGKKELVKARLAKRLRELNLNSYAEYINLVRSKAGESELTLMLDALSTNLTSFFRESDHFDYLAQRILTPIKGSPRPLRIWSSACSSGEEPYTIGITLHETLSNMNAWDARILATDISTKVLKKAMQGLYPGKRLESVSSHLHSKYFDRVDGRRAEDRNERLYQVQPALRSMVHFAHLNLMNAWPMKGPFDVIFCRNVMIYFDKPTQGKLVNRFWELLRPGGTLFIGHSESLTGIKHSFKYIQPTVYEK